MRGALNALVGYRSLLFRSSGYVFPVLKKDGQVALKPGLPPRGNQENLNPSGLSAQSGTRKLLQYEVNRRALSAARTHLVIHS
jgi:hypothetical protein